MAEKRHITCTFYDLFRDSLETPSVRTRKPLPVKQSASPGKVVVAVRKCTQRIRKPGVNVFEPGNSMYSVDNKAQVHTCDRKCYPG